LEIALPLVALALFGIIAILLSPLRERVESMRDWFWIVSGAGVAALATTCTLLWLRRRGRRIPAAVTVFSALLPWLAGLGGMRYGMHQAGQLIDESDWSSHGQMALRGYARSNVSAAYGLLISAALLSAIAVAWGVRASGDRSRALVGTTVVLVALAFVGPGMAEFGTHGTPDPDWVTSMTYVYVDDVEAHYRRVMDSNAVLRADLHEHFGGNKQYTISDPFGQRWTFAEPIAGETT